MSYAKSAYNLNMDKQLSVIEFEILGYKVKLREKEGDESSVSAHDVVDLVRRESNKIMDKAPQLASGEVALLAALQLAQENLELSKSYKEELDNLKTKAGEALNLIEDVSPTTM